MDIRCHQAIGARHSHRKPFAPRRVEDGLRRELLGAPGVDGVGLRVLAEPAEIAALARLLNHSALVLRADRAYQRELTAVAAGLDGSLLTQPFQLHEVRAGLAENLALGGFPQLLLRFGHRTTTRADGPRSRVVQDQRQR